MCGIIGFAGVPKNKEALWSLAQALLVETRVRGKDGTGFYSLAGDEILYDKSLQPSDVFVEKNKLLSLMKDHVPEIFVGHCRAASVGQKFLRNCHPFVSEDEQLALVHNGTLRPYERTMLQWLGRKAAGETDSEMILRFIEIFETVPEAIERLFRVVRLGTQACAMVDSENEEVWLWRNSARPLCFFDARATLGVTLFFSTPDIFVKAYKKAFERQRAPAHMRGKIIALRKNHLYRLDSTGAMYRRVVRVPDVPVVWAGCRGSTSSSN